MKGRFLLDFEVVVLQDLDGVDEPRVGHSRCLPLEVIGGEGGPQECREVCGRLLQRLRGLALQMRKVVHAFQDPEVGTSHGEGFRIERWRSGSGGRAWPASTVFGHGRGEAAFQVSGADRRAVGSCNAQ